MRRCRSRLLSNTPKCEFPLVRRAPHLRVLKKSITLDQTGYGAIQRVHLGPLNRTFPAPYSPASALSAENPCFGPRTRVPRSEPKIKGQNGAKPEPATGMAGGGAQVALGTAGSMGRAGLVVVPLVPFFLARGP